MKRLYRSVGMGIVLSMVALLILTASAAAAKPAPTVTVGSWSYTAISNTVAANNINWDNVRADWARIGVQNASETGTSLVCNVDGPSIAGKENKNPQNLNISGLCTNLTTGSSYKMQVMLYKGTTLVASSDLVFFTAGTNYP